MKYAFLSAVPFALLATGAVGQDYQTALSAFYSANLQQLRSAPELVAAVAAANTAHAGIDQAAIDGLDTAWRAEVGAAATPTIAPILANPAADFLRQQITAANGTILEAFITDQVGLNVAVSAPTSDMWQGDEDKFTLVYPAGPDAVHYGEVELDESTQTYQAQISFPVVDPATNAVIGTVTVGVNAEALL